MFPTDRPLPVLCEKRDLASDVQFRLSQVVGNFQAGRRKKRPSDDDKQPTVEDTRWKLTKDENHLRCEFLGSEINRSVVSHESGRFPLSLRKRFLKGREVSYSAQTPVDLSRYKLGCTLSIVRTIQEEFGARYDPGKVAVPPSFSRKSVVQSLFPLKKSDVSPCPLGSFLRRKMRVADTIDASIEISTNLLHAAPGIANNTAEKPTCTNNGQSVPQQLGAVKRDCCSFATPSSNDEAKRQNPPEVFTAIPVPKQNLPGTSKIRSIQNKSSVKKISNPYASKLKTAAGVAGKQSACAVLPANSTVALLQRPKSVDAQKENHSNVNVTSPFVVDLSNAPTPAVGIASVGAVVGSSRAVSVDDVVSNNKTTTFGIAAQYPANTEGDFCLPPPDSSSDEEDSDNENGNIDEIEAPLHLDKSNKNQEALSLERVQQLDDLRDHDVEDIPYPCKVARNPSDCLSQSSFRLPTQDSSSSEEESDDETVCPNTNKQLSNESQEIEMAKLSTARNEAILEAIGSIPKDPDEDDEDEAMPLVSRRDNNATSNDSNTNVGLKRSPYFGHDSQESVAIRRGKNFAKKMVNPFLTQVESSSNTKTPRHKLQADSGLTDTPISLVDTSYAIVTRKNTVLLADTPDKAYREIINVDEENVPCAICLSPICDDDVNPIVFCDGFAGYTCSLAVHAKCYTISKDAWECDNEWRCDSCHLQHQILTKKRGVDQNLAEHAQCRICKKKNGPLKRVSDKFWHHPHCVKWRNDFSVVQEVCVICGVTGATRCGREGCQISVHPYCAVQQIATNDCSWTLLRIGFSSSLDADSDDKENCQHMLFCESDQDEARKISKNLCAAQQVVISTIPPDCLIAKPRRLKRLGAAKASRSTNQQTIAVNKPVPAQVGDSEEARKARKRARLESLHRARRFIDDEADIDSDDEGDDEENRQLAELEAEEHSQSSFINDSSQLGYTQDDLGRLEDTSATPVAASLSQYHDHNDDTVHRRLDNDRARQHQFATPLLNRKMTRHSLTPADAPSSEKGLGNMHFVRSVLEHHKNGGDVNDIEREFHRLQREVEVDADVTLDDLGDDDDDQGTTGFDYGL